MMGRMHQVLGSNPVSVRLLGKIINQCEMVRGRSLVGFAPDFIREEWFLQRFPGRISTVVDVGANVGDWTAMLAELRSADRPEFLLFEPVSSTAAVLLKRFQNDPRVRVRCRAVGDFTGEVTIHVAAANDKLSSIAFAPAGAKSTETVGVVRLDDELSLAGMDSVDYLKIDTEGFDLHVLRGAEESIRLRRVKAIQFEYLGGAWRALRSTLAEALNLLENRCGWQCWYLAEGGLSRYDYANSGETPVSMCFVAVPGEDAAKLNGLQKGN
jgi:FkbM family methyltransferase